MYEVFREAILVLDHDDVDAIIAEFDENDELTEEHQVGNDNISIIYVPIRKLSYGNSSCSIKIACTNCK